MEMINIAKDIKNIIKDKIMLLKGNDSDYYDEIPKSTNIFYICMSGLFGLGIWLIILGMCLLLNGCVYG